MNKRRVPKTAGRFLALFICFVVALPTPALALRQTLEGTTEPEIAAGLEEREKATPRHRVAGAASISSQDLIQKAFGSIREEAERRAVIQRVDGGGFGEFYNPTEVSAVGNLNKKTDDLLEQLAKDLTGQADAVSALSKHVRQKRDRLGRILAVRVLGLLQDERAVQTLTALWKKFPPDPDDPGAADGLLLSAGIISLSRFWKAGIADDTLAGEVETILTDFVAAARGSAVSKVAGGLGSGLVVNRARNIAAEALTNSRRGSPELPKRLFKFIQNEKDSGAHEEVRDTVLRGIGGLAHRIGDQPLRDSLLLYLTGMLDERQPRYSDTYDTYDSYRWNLAAISLGDLEDTRALPPLREWRFRNGSLKPPDRIGVVDHAIAQLEKLETEAWDPREVAEAIQRWTAAVFPAEWQATVRRGSRKVNRHYTLLAFVVTPDIAESISVLEDVDLFTERRGKALVSVYIYVPGSGLGAMSATAIADAIIPPLVGVMKKYGWAEDQASVELWRSQLIQELPVLPTSSGTGEALPQPPHSLGQEVPLPEALPGGGEFWRTVFHQGIEAEKTRQGADTMAELLAAFTPGQPQALYEDSEVGVRIGGQIRTQREASPATASSALHLWASLGADVWDLDTLQNTFGDLASGKPSPPFVVRYHGQALLVALSRQENGELWFASDAVETAEDVEVFVALTAFLMHPIQQARVEGPNARLEEGWGVSAPLEREDWVRQLPDDVKQILQEHGIRTVASLAARSAAELCQDLGIELGVVKTMYREVRGYRYHRLAGRVPHPEQYPAYIESLGLRQKTVHQLHDRGIFTTPELQENWRSGKLALRITWASPGEEWKPVTKATYLELRSKLGSPPTAQGMEAETGVKAVAGTGVARIIGAAGRVSLAFETARRIGAEQHSANPTAPTLIAGIGPTQAAQQAGILQVISHLLPEDLRIRMFVLTADAGLASTLTSRGFMAGTKPSTIAGLLKRRFRSSNLRADYQATDEEQQALGSAIEAVRLPNVILVQRVSPEFPQEFLRQLLSSFSGVPPEAIERYFDLPQMTEDVALLVEA